MISAGNREVSSLAKDALAALYAKTNRTKESVALYQELINKPTDSVSKVTAQLQLAELYQNSNQPLDAKRTLRADQERQSRQRSRATGNSEADDHEVEIRDSGPDVRFRASCRVSRFSRSSQKLKHFF